MSGTYDIAVVGSGFAGSLMAMIARRQGFSVILLEKGAHPRFAIGESSTPLSNLLLEELATRYALPALKALAKWGSWQRTYPEVACGLKRGFTFHHHSLTSPAFADPDHNDQLLVAASPRDEIADTHWYRANFDHLLVQEAQALGVEYIDQVALHTLTEAYAKVTLGGQRDGRKLELHARFVVDATGPRGFLHRALRLGEAEFPNYPVTEALYSHFSGVHRLEDISFARTAEIPPYPVDDAAVHHVFDGGWVWVLQFNNGVTSAGVAATDACATQLRFSEGGPAWDRLLQRIPALQEQFKEGVVERPFNHMPRLSFRSAQIAGRRWALLPSAAGFVDPLLSTGFPLTLLGVSRLATIIADDWETPRFTKRLQDYATHTDTELLATARLISALYANMNNFRVFTALSLLYFAAASYSEAARRLGKSHLASSFLLCTEPTFELNCVDICQRARRPLTTNEADALIGDIQSAIEPFNIAGLGRPERRNWYPVEARDLLEDAGKLGATREEISAMLLRCGFRQEHELPRS